VKSGEQLFDRSQLPGAIVFYERELGRLTRPNRAAWRLGNCPFHKSKSKKSFSVHESGRFRCFGCAAHGPDVVAFVRLRDHCDFPTACQTLGCWADVTPVERIRIDALNREREEQREQAAEAAARARRERLDVRNELHTLVKILRESGERLDELDARGEDESEAAEREWEILRLAFEDLRVTENEYARLSGLEDVWL
jgi:DNA primase